MCTLLRFSLDSSCGRSIEGGDTVPLAVPTLSLWLSGNFSRIPHPWYLTARARDQWPSLEIRYTKVAEIQFKCFNPLWFTIPFYVQLSKSSRAFFWGAYFSAVSGWKSIPISVPGPYECLEWYRLLVFFSPPTAFVLPQAVTMLLLLHWRFKWI